MKNITVSSLFVFALSTTLFAQNESSVTTDKMQYTMLSAAISTKELVATKKTKTFHVEKQANRRPIIDLESAIERKAGTEALIGVKAFPNPFATDLSVSINDVSTINSIYEAALFDLQGRKVFSQELSSKLSKLNLVGIANGIYVLNVQKNGNTILQEKVIKQQ